MDIPIKMDPYEGDKVVEILELVPDYYPHHEKSHCDHYPGTVHNSEDHILDCISGSDKVVESYVDEHQHHGKKVPIYPWAHQFESHPKDYCRVTNKYIPDTYESVSHHDMKHEDGVDGHGLHTSLARINKSLSPSLTSLSTTSTILSDYTLVSEPQNYDSTHRWTTKTIPNSHDWNKWHMFDPSPYIDDMPGLALLATRKRFLSIM